jgi:hypothetical protein
LKPGLKPAPTFRLICALAGQNRGAELLAAITSIDHRDLTARPGSGTRVVLSVDRACGSFAYSPSIGGITAGIFATE